jgi:hypothetical protein
MSTAQIATSIDGTRRASGRAGQNRPAVRSTMKLVNQTLLVLATIGTLVAVACAPAPGMPPERSDELTDPFPAHRSTLATPVREEPLVNPSAPTAPDVPPVEAVQVTASVAELLRQYLADTFGSSGLKAAWYDNVRQIAVQFTTAIVQTDLTAAPPDQEKAQAICQVVAQFPTSAQGQQLRSIAVQVYGRDHQLLASSRDATAQHQSTDAFVASVKDP